jgi:hypothetical protein
LEVYKKNVSIVEKPFEGDTGFAAALDKVNDSGNIADRADI